MKLLPEYIEDYASRFTEKESDVLKELNRETHSKVLNPGMLSGHLQGRILSLFSRLINPENILEIGTYTGYSAICLSEGLRDGGTLYTIDKNEELESFARKYFDKAGISSRVDLRIGNALNIISDLDCTFDLVFIDADKENYVHYYHKVIDKVNQGGLIIADNVLWSGKVVDKNQNDKDTIALREYVQQVNKDERVRPLLMPIRDGLMIAQKSNQIG